MAGQIRITPSQMRERTAQYRREADEIHTVVSRLDTLLGQLLGEWEGAASESFALRYHELKPGFLKAEELVREIAAALDATAEIAESTADKIANQFIKY